MKPTRKAIKQFGLKPRKRFGQHFLTDEKILQKIVELAEVSSKDIIIEIGPGPGSLTKYLVQKAQKVYAIEVDPEIIKLVKAEISAPNLELINADILKFNFNEINMLSPRFKVISNLPYNISTQIIFKLLETRVRFSELYLMLQKEVAQRIIAKPGSKEYGILSVIAQIHSEPEVILQVGPEAFYPRPKVDSALVRFKILENFPLQIRDYFIFKKVLKACFRHRRKTILNSLFGSDLHLSKARILELLSQAGISSQSRAEEIAIEKLVQLANLYCEEKTLNA